MSHQPRHMPRLGVGTDLRGLDIPSPLIQAVDQLQGAIRAGFGNVDNPQLPPRPVQQWLRSPLGDAFLDFEAYGTSKPVIDLSTQDSPFRIYGDGRRRTVQTIHDKDHAIGGGLVIAKNVAGLWPSPNPGGLNYYGPQLIEFATDPAEEPLEAVYNVRASVKAWSCPTNAGTANMVRGHWESRGWVVPRVPAVATGTTANGVSDETAPILRVLIELWFASVAAHDPGASVTVNTVNVKIFRLT